MSRDISTPLGSPIHHQTRPTSALTDNVKSVLFDTDTESKGSSLSNLHFSSVNKPNKVVNEEYTEQREYRDYIYQLSQNHEDQIMLLMAGKVKNVIRLKHDLLWRQMSGMGIVRRR